MKSLFRVSRNHPNEDLHRKFGAKYFFPRESPIQSIFSIDFFAEILYSVQQNRRFRWEIFIWVHYSIAFGRHIGFSIEIPTRLYYNEVFNRNLNFVFRIHVVLGNIPFSPTFSGKSSIQNRSRIEVSVGKSSCECLIVMHLGATYIFQLKLQLVFAEMKFLIEIFIS